MKPAGLREKIRWRFALWAIAIKKRSINTDMISLQDSWKEVKNCLVIWPAGGLDVTAGEVVLKKLYSRFPGSQIHIAALPGVGASILSDIPFELLQLEEEHYNVFGLPKRSTIDSLLKLNAGLAIDLAPEFNPHSAYLCLLSQSPLQIGFANGLHDPPFNYQIAPSSERKGLERYRVLAEYIG